MLYLFSNFNRSDYRARRRGLLVFVGCVLIFVVFVTLLRKESELGLLNALMNRVFYTPFYQIEKASVLYVYQEFPGQWLLADLLARAGLDTETLQQAVWRIDNPFSQFVGGSYHYIGDLVGNFSYFGIFFYVIICFIFYGWDDFLGPQLAGYFRYGALLNDFLLYLVFRISFFTLSASLVPVVIVSCLVPFFLRQQRKSADLRVRSRSRRRREKSRP